MSKFFDSHCHLTDVNVHFDSAYYEQHFYACVSKNMADWSRVIELAEHPQIIPLVGIHPWYALKTQPQHLEVLNQLIANTPKLQLGEIGLDFYQQYRNSKREQLALFESQLALAETYCRSISVHSRKSSNEIYQQLRNRQLKGVMHGFNSSLQEAKKFCDINMKIGIGFNLLKANASNSILLVESLPLDALVIESDYPYMINTGQYPLESMFKLVKKISEIKKIAPCEVSNALMNNTKDVFNV